MESLFNTVKNAHLHNISKNTANQTVFQRASSKFDVKPMFKDEARKILNFEQNSFNKFQLEEKYKDLLQRNSESNGGTHYIRSKIQNAYDVLKKDF